ncbi:unnamed protein product, partial [Mesorhabditis belari]|uniref:ribonuclease H n=1 Tax=Mesorhabditis belari TaxID=2138241 RepID=A0AAF3EUI0_9BILA
MLQYSVYQLNIINSTLQSEKLEIPRSGAGGSGGPNRLLPPKQQQDILIAMRKGDRHANVLSELQWNTIKIYTDGAIDRPEKKQRDKGYGVWFGTSHPLNKIHPLSSSSEMRNSTLVELTAIEEALKQVINPNYYCCQPVAIFTDSLDAVSYLSGTQDIPPNMQKKVAAIKEKMENVLGGVRFEHVKGHAYVYGNVQADNFAGAARLGNTIPDPTWKELPTSTRVDMRPEELLMVKRLQHAKDIAELDWKTIVVYIAVNKIGHQYAGWFGRDHPLNFAYNAEGKETADKLSLAVETVLGKLNGWKYYVGKPVCIVVTDQRFKEWGKDKELPKALQRDFPTRVTALTELMAGLQGDVVQFQSIHEEWEVPGWKKAHALIRSKAVRHHPDCPKVKP